MSDCVLGFRYWDMKPEHNVRKMSQETTQNEQPRINPHFITPLAGKGTATNRIGAGSRHFAVRFRRFRLWLFLGLAWFVAQPAAAAVCYVDQAAGSNGTGTSWAQAFDNLQDALNNPSCNEVWVAKGNYRPTYNNGPRTATFKIRSGQRVLGGFDGTETSHNQRDPNPATNGTVLSGGISPGSANRSYHVVSFGNASPNTLLDGFTVRDGWGTTDGGGGGIYCMPPTNGECSPTLRNLIISHNRGSNGAGMHITAGGLASASPSLKNVLFLNNVATEHGGALSNTGHSSYSLENVVFRNNSAGENGGAIRSTRSNSYSGSLSFNKVMFEGNQAGGRGGAMHMYVWQYGSGQPNTTEYSVSFSDVVFDNNQATEDGGAISAETSTLTDVQASFDGVTFSNNRSSADGGAIWMYLYDDSGIELTNTTFHNNTADFDGGAIWLNAQYYGIVHSTFSGNDASVGSAAYFHGALSQYPHVQNNIFWNSSGSSTALIYSVGSLTMEDNIIRGGCPGSVSCTNVIDADPMLSPLQISPGNDFIRTMRPSADSPAIDAGTDIGVTVDQRGVQRMKNGSNPDLGAVELDHYTVDIHVDGGNGSVAPMSATVREGGTTSFNVFPDSGYFVSHATGCGGNYDSDQGTYVTASIIEDCTVTIKFGSLQPAGFLVKATVTGGSAILDPPTQQQLIYPGGVAQWTVTPINPNMRVTTFFGGCPGQLTGNTFTTEPLQSGCTINFLLILDSEIFEDGFE